MGSMQKSRLSQYKQARLVEHFVAGTTARTTASLCGVNRKTAAFYFLRLHEIIAYELEAESEAMFGGEIEVDESYFGGSWKGKRGRWLFYSSFTLKDLRWAWQYWCILCGKVLIGAKINRRRQLMRTSRFQLQ